MVRDTGYLAGSFRSLNPLQRLLIPYDLFFFFSGFNPIKTFFSSSATRIPFIMKLTPPVYWEEAMLSRQAQYLPHPL